MLFYTYITGGNVALYRDMQETLLAKEEQSKDQVEATLKTIAQSIIVIVFGLLPLFFLPIPYIGFDYFKTIIVIIGVLLALIFYSLSILRSGEVRIAAPLALWAMWGIALASIISASLSGDMFDAFVGNTIGVHTSLFVLLLAVVATVLLMIGLSKATIMRLYVLLTGSTIVLALFHGLRLIFGPEFLALSVFQSTVSTPLGSWNDLALFFGLSILVSLVALEQLPLTKIGKGLFTVGIVFSLCVLAIVNFFAVWVVLGLVSLIVLMYSLTKDRFTDRSISPEKIKALVSVQSVVLSVTVFIISLVFIIGGASVGGYISKITGVSYIEVRPSFEATMDITRNVFSQNAFVGIGPNKFADAWRMYKDPSINQTVFWSTDFNGANGYLTTFFATTGIIGIVAWLVFLGLFLFAGLRMLLRSAYGDKFWYFIGSSSFLAAVYLWGMSAIYVPSAAVLILASVFTAVMFASYTVLVGVKPFGFSIANNKQAGILLVGIIMVVIVGASTALYFTGKHYAAVHAYEKAIASAQAGGDLDAVLPEINAAYESIQNDTYAAELATIELGRINTLANLPELTTEQQQMLETSVQQGVRAAQVAVSLDETDSVYWSTLGSIYSILASAAVEGAKDRALEAFANARRFDPTNPVHVLLEAQLASRTGDLAGARTKAAEAIAMKSNYTDALFFLTQLDIAEGKTEDAIIKTRAIISLEPNNPARHYQLGVLESASGNLNAAITAFERAVALDTNYANARYFLALAYAQQDNSQGAIEQLQKVLELNPGNDDVEALIAQIQSGEPLDLGSQVSASSRVDEPETVTSENETVTTTENPDTPLISPVNTVGEDTETQTNEETDPTLEEGA